MALLDKLGIAKEVLKCKSFDEVLSKGYFANLSESQQIAVYKHFTLQETEREKAIPYSDWSLSDNLDSLEQQKRNLNIFVEGAETSIRDLIEEGYCVRVCGEKGKSLRGLAAWFDEGDWKYLGVIYVSPKFRRNGIMGGLIDDGYDGRPITTKVHSGNEPALRAFEKYGFEIQKKEGDYLEMVRL